MIIPSIDLREGRAVQLVQGKKLTITHDKPLHLAKEFSRYGELAVIDLDAAMGWGENLNLIEKICHRYPARVGGGIRSLEMVAKILSFGARKIIIGTRAFQTSGRSSVGLNCNFLNQLKKMVGRERIIIALDYSQGKILVEGWQKKTDLSLEEVIPEVEKYAGEILLTCVDQEGLLQGPDRDRILRLASQASTLVTAAGGISTVEDVRVFSRAGINVQIGMALYTGTLPLREAFLATVVWEKGENNLIPTITVDQNGQVLTLAYSSQESLRRTFTTGEVWYFSRSRNCLWLKGETSRNRQKFIRVRTDCDGDALLITASPQGPACHTGQYSCFGPREFHLGELFETIQNRLAVPSPNSYTASLSMAETKAKLKEEVLELLLAMKEEELIWEAADVLYFLLVFLAKKGVHWEDVLRELRRRRRVPHLKRGGGSRGLKLVSRGR